MPFSACPLTRLNIYAGSCYMGYGRVQVSHKCGSWISFLYLSHVLETISMIVLEATCVCVHFMSDIYLSGEDNSYFLGLRIPVFVNPNSDVRDTFLMFLIFWRLLLYLIRRGESTPIRSCTYRNPL